MTPDPGSTEPFHIELVRLIGELSGDAIEWTADLAATVRRIAWKLLWIGSAAATVWIIAISLGLGWLAWTAFLAVSVVVVLVLVLMAPASIAIEAAAQRYVAVRNVLATIAGVLIGLYLFILAASVLPLMRSVGGSFLAMTGAVLSGIAITRSGVVTVGHRIRAVQLIVVILTVLKLVVFEVFPQTLGATRSALAKVDRIIAWRLDTMPGLEPTTTELVVRTSAQLDDVTLFDADGKALVWYATFADRCPALFSTPGRHPRTNEELKPITKEAAASLKQCLVEREQKERDRLARLEEAQRLEEEARRRSELQALVLRPAEGHPADRSTALALDVAPGVAIDGGSATRVLVESLTSAEAVPDGQALLADPFTTQFRDDGHFDSIMKGDAAVLADMDVFSIASRVLLGKLDGTCGKHPAQAGMFLCRLSLSFKTFNESGRLADSGQLESNGIGFDPEAAARRGIERLAEVHGARISRALFGSVGAVSKVTP